ncbi:hypothetical protein SteCoe_15396 [Stentor coeruleus]|uniref:Uncharacterized protein n=1 Tax=Stentor coeruleus TaxID=5963 RepID=A0A1R2C3J9_9CILI|nr:hypothetical protein SteCoe_15396 [Stentor coeruleus]
MNLSFEKTNTEAEELLTAICYYKQKIKQAESKKIKNYNRMYKEKMLKKVNLREEDKLSLTSSLIFPSLCTINIHGFYGILCRIAKIFDVPLKIAPTLFLPCPGYYIYTNSKGILQINDAADCFSRFFDNIENNQQETVGVACIFKKANQKIRLFRTTGQAKAYALSKPSISGTMQEFIVPANDVMSIFKAHWKNHKYKYYLVCNRKKVEKQKSKHPRSQSAQVGVKIQNKLETGLLEAFNKKKRESLKSIASQNLNNNTGLTNHLKNKFRLPWKPQFQSSMYMTKEESSKFLVSCQSITQSYMHPVHTSNPDIEKTIQLVNHLLKKFCMNEKYEIIESVCEFIKDSQKNWILINCPQIKVQSVECKEINREVIEKDQAFRSDSESEFIDEISQRVEDASKNPDNAGVNNQEANLKSQFSMKSPKTLTFYDKFRKTISNIDRIRKKERINPNVGLPYELAQEYKNNFQIDRNGNMSNIMLSHSNSTPFNKSFYVRPHRSPSLTLSLMQNSLYSSSKSYDVYGATDIVNRHCAESLEDYERILIGLKRSKQRIRHLDEKNTKNLCQNKTVAE